MKSLLKTSASLLLMALLSPFYLAPLCLAATYEGSTVTNIENSVNFPGALTYTVDTPGGPKSFDVCVTAHKNDRCGAIPGTQLPKDFADIKPQSKIFATTRLVRV